MLELIPLYLLALTARGATRAWTGVATAMILVDWLGIAQRPAAAAPEAFARLSAGLDEAIVRIITARPGPEPVFEAMTALTPAAIRGADRP